MEIKINYEAVYSKTAELRQQIQAELQEMETSYRQSNASLNKMDSRTNAELMYATELKHQTYQLAAEILIKQLSFIDASARQVERDEAMIARVFTQPRANQRTNAGRTPSTSIPSEGGTQ